MPVTIAAVTGVSNAEAGLASGLINTSQQIGGALGLAVLSAIATNVTGELRTIPRPEQVEALNDGFRAAFLTGAGFAVLGAILAFLMISTRDSRAHLEAVQSGDPEAMGVAV